MKILGTIDKKRDWLDFSSTSLMLRCPMSYYWRIIRKLEKAHGKSALINGKAYHQAIDTYNTARINGMTWEMACKLGLAELPSIMAEIDEDHPKRNLQVAESFVQGYFTRWKDEPYKVEYVEIGFAVHIDNGPLFVGKIDSIKKSPMGLFVNETKTTTVVGDRWYMRGKPNLQIDSYVSAYAILTGKMPAGGILDVIPIHENASKRKDPFRVITMREEKDVDLWIQQVTEYWRMITRWRDQEFFPMNTENCVPLLGWTCEYLPLCERYPNACKQGNLEIPEEFQRNNWAPFAELMENEKEA